MRERKRKKQEREREKESTGKREIENTETKRIGERRINVCGRN